MPNKFGRCCCAPPPDDSDWQQVIAHAWWPGFLGFDVAGGFATANGHLINSSEYLVPQFGRSSWMARRRAWDLQGTYDQTKYRKMTVTQELTQVIGPVASPTTTTMTLAMEVVWNAAFGDLESVSVVYTNTAGGSFTDSWNRTDDEIYFADSTLWNTAIGGGLVNFDDLPWLQWAPNDEVDGYVLSIRGGLLGMATPGSWGDSTRPWEWTAPPEGEDVTFLSDTEASQEFDADYSEAWRTYIDVILGSPDPTAIYQVHYEASITLSDALSIEDVADASDALLAEVSLNSPSTDHNACYESSVGGGSFNIPDGLSAPNLFTDVNLIFFYDGPETFPDPPTWTQRLVVIRTRESGAGVVKIWQSTTATLGDDFFGNPIYVLPERVSGRGCSPWGWQSISFSDPDQDIINGVYDGGVELNYDPFPSYDVSPFKVVLPGGRSWFDYPEPKRSLASIKTIVKFKDGLKCANTTTVTCPGDDTTIGADFESVYEFNRTTGERMAAACGATGGYTRTFSPTTFMALTGDADACGDTWINPIFETCLYGPPFTRADCCA